MSGVWILATNTDDGPIAAAYADLDSALADLAVDLGLDDAAEIPDPDRGPALWDAPFDTSEHRRWIWWSDGGDVALAWQPGA